MNPPNELEKNELFEKKEDNLEITDSEHLKTEDSANAKTTKKKKKNLKKKEENKKNEEMDASAEKTEETKTTNEDSDFEKELLWCINQIKLGMKLNNLDKDQSNFLYKFLINF